MKKELHISEQLYQDVDVLRKKIQPEAEMDMFVEHILRSGLKQESTTVYHERDEEAIKERLKALGYID